MNEVGKLITVKNVESAGLYGTMAEIFSSIVFAHRDILNNQYNIKLLGLKIFKQRKREYLRATRPQAFFGRKSSLDILRESNEYATTEMIMFLNSFAGIDDDIVARFLRLAKHAPESFLSASMQVINGVDWTMNFPGMAEKLIQFIELMEEKLKGFQP